jgi:hypothetical protein
MRLTLEHAKSAADNPSAYSREELELALVRLKSVGRRAHTERSADKLIARLERLENELETIRNQDEARRI